MFFKNITKKIIAALSKNKDIYYKEKLFFIIMCGISIPAYLVVIMYCCYDTGSVIESINSPQQTDIPVWVPKVISMTLIYILYATLYPLYKLGTLRGSSVLVSKKQFAEINQIVNDFAIQLDLKQLPEVYVKQSDGALNAFAMRLFCRDIIMLNSDLFECTYNKNMDALRFVIGHEMCHIKRGHLNPLKVLFILPACLLIFPFLAYKRACEYTCDRGAYKLTKHKGLEALVLITSGKRIYKEINID